MVERRTPIPIGESVKKVMEFARSRETEFISINDSHGRFLAKDIKATHDVPPSTGPRATAMLSERLTQRMHPKLNRLSLK